jgi:hypothetical protein
MVRCRLLGFPPTFLAGSLIEAPFDFMSDTLCGMRGIVLDTLLRPERLLAAGEKVLQFQLEFATSLSTATGLKVAFIPLVVASMVAWIRSIAVERKAKAPILDPHLPGFGQQANLLSIIPCAPSGARGPNTGCLAWRKRIGK